MKPAVSPQIRDQLASPALDQCEEILALDAVSLSNIAALDIGASQVEPQPSATHVEQRTVQQLGRSRLPRRADTPRLPYPTVGPLLPNRSYIRAVLIT